MSFRKRRGDGNAVERAAAAAGCGYLLLCEAQRNARLGRGRSRGDEILLGRDLLVEQSLLAAQVGFRERKPSARGFYLVRPDGHVAARRHALAPAALGAAIRRMMGLAP